MGGRRKSREPEIRKDKDDVPEPEIHSEVGWSERNLLSIA